MGVSGVRNTVACVFANLSFIGSVKIEWLRFSQAVVEIENVLWIGSKGRNGVV